MNMTIDEFDAWIDDINDYWDEYNRNHPEPIETEYEYRDRKGIVSIDGEDCRPCTIGSNGTTYISLKRLAELDEKYPREKSLVYD